MNTTQPKHDGKAIIDEYLKGRRAALRGAAVPSDASKHFLDGHRETTRELSISRVGWDYKQGLVSWDVVADVVQGKREYPALTPHPKGPRLGGVRGDQ